MKFEGRKLYKHSQSKDIYLVQLPKLVCQDMKLTKDDTLDLDYVDGKIILTKTEAESNG